MTASIRPWRTDRHLASALIALLALVVASCQSPPPPPPPVAKVSNEALPLDQAIAFATDSLAAQSQPPAEPPKLLDLLAKKEPPAPRSVLLDPSLDSASAQQTALTRLLDQKIADRLRSRHPQFDVLPFQQASLAKAQLLLVATIARRQVGRGVYEINLALTDLKSGLVVAQATSVARDDGFDTTPTPYYRDTPVVLLKDQVVEGYLRSSRIAPGQKADSAYLDRVAAAAMIGEATTHYDNERYREALGLYRGALATPAGEQMRAINGVYLTNWKLGNVTEAEQAFGKLVAVGLASKNLGVKFLFNPGTTDFWSDPKINGPYGLWLRQIARQAAGAKVCLDVVGHTSRTGSEPYNDRLSEQRAAFIQRKLEAEASPLVGRMKSSGVGWRQNLIGTGTDDASDSLDRRVEFKIHGCDN